MYLNLRLLVKNYFTEKSMKCWEYAKCGREAGGTKVRRLGLCPAYPHHGKDFTYFAGPLCTVKKEDTLALNLSAHLNNDVRKSFESINKRD